MLYLELIKKGFTRSEAAVTELACKGLSNEEIAGQLFVTKATVKFHFRNVYKKLKVKSRAQMLIIVLPYTK